jgi:hypothetical protein
MRRAARLMERHRSEIVDWLVRESGSTRLKAETEWQFSYYVVPLHLSLGRGPGRLGRLTGSRSVEPLSTCPICGRFVFRPESRIGKRTIMHATARSLLCTQLR